MLGEFQNDQQFVEKNKLANNLYAENQTRNDSYLQILIQSYPQLSIYLPQVNREFRNKGLYTIFGRIQILIKTKKYKIKTSP